MLLGGVVGLTLIGLAWGTKGCHLSAWWVSILTPLGLALDIVGASLLFFADIREYNNLLMRDLEREKSRLLNRARHVLFLGGDTHENRITPRDEEFEEVSSLIAEKIELDPNIEPIRVGVLATRAAGGGGVGLRYVYPGPEGDSEATTRLEHSVVEFWITERIRELQTLTKRRLRFRGIGTLGLGFSLQLIAFVVGVGWVTRLLAQFSLC